MAAITRSAATSSTKIESFTASASPSTTTGTPVTKYSPPRSSANCSWSTASWTRSTASSRSDSDSVGFIRTWISAALSDGKR